MRINENKKGILTALFLGLGLFVLGLIGYLYGFGGSAIFAMIVGVLCFGICLRKYFSSSFILLDDDGFSITKSTKSFKIYFKDCEKIGIKTISYKNNNSQILCVKFKKGKLDHDGIFALAQTIGDDEMMIYDKYVKSKFFLSKILNEKFEKLNK